VQRASEHPSSVELASERPSSGPAPPNRAQGPSRPHPLSTRISCATPDLLLKHPNATVATYKRRQMKQLKHASETFTKTTEKHLKTIANKRNI
jgi:hypothetical protein